MTIHYEEVDLGDLENPRFIKRCVHWMVERYNIHLKKDVEKLPPPWTQEKGFDIRYCNVKREMDRESISLIKSTCLNPDLTLEEKMLNCLIFRLVNKHVSYSELGFPRKKGLISHEEIDQIEEKVCKYLKSHPEYTPWTAAYMTGGAIRAMKNKVRSISPVENSLTVLLHIWNLIQTEYRVADALEYNDSQECLNYMLEQHYPGCNTFLTYQIFLDWTYCPEFPLSEDEGVFSGPGCNKGLWRLYFGDSCTYHQFAYTLKKRGITPEDLLRIVRKNSERYFQESGIDLKELMYDLPENKRYFTLANWENTMCEFQKYWRYLNEQDGSGSGKKKRYYDFENWDRRGNTSPPHASASLNLFLE